MIAVKIDVKKLLKNHFFQGKTGALYCDLLVIPSKEKKYDNDYYVVQSVSKEARERGEKGPIVGNARNLEDRRATTAPAPAPNPAADDGEDVPF